MPVYKQDVADPGGNTGQAAVALAPSSGDELAGFLTIVVVSTSSAGKPVWVVHLGPGDSAPTMQWVYDNGTPITAASGRLPLFNPSVDQGTTRPAKVFLAMKDGDGSAAVRGIA